MSGSEEHDVPSLTHELADTPGALPVLVTLFERQQPTTREALSAAHDRRPVDDAIRWLAAVKLIRRTDAAGTLDLAQPGTFFELTAAGLSFTRALIELTRVLTQPEDTVRRKAGIAEE